MQNLRLADTTSCIRSPFIKCDICDSVVIYVNFSRHLRSVKHTNSINKLDMCNVNISQCHTKSDKHLLTKIMSELSDYEAKYHDFLVKYNRLKKNIKDQKVVEITKNFMLKVWTTI